MVFVMSRSVIKMLHITEVNITENKLIIRKLRYFLDSCSKGNTGEYIVISDIENQWLILVLCIIYRNVNGRLFELT